MATFKIDLPDGRSVHVDAASPQEAADGAEEWASANPMSHAPASGQPRSVMQDVSGLMANFNRGTGIGDELAAGGGAVLDTIMGKGGQTPPDIGTRTFAGLAGLDPRLAAGFMANFRTRMGTQRQTEDSFTQAHPNIAALSRGTGMGGTVLLPTGPAVTGPNMVVNAIKGATVAGGNAALYGAMDRGTPAERLHAASSAATNPIVLALGAAGGALATPRGPRPGPPKGPADVLDQAGVFLTPGQRAGGMVKGVEDLAQRAPILGTAVRGARARSIESLNRAVANQALAPIGETLPNAVAAGHRAVDYVAQRLGGVYDKAASLVPVMEPDPEFGHALSNLSANVQELGPSVSAQFDTILRNRLFGRAADRPLTGREWRDAESQIGKRAAEFMASDDGAQRALGQSLNEVTGLMRDALGRVSPQARALIDQANPGYAIYTRLRSAASKAPKGGIFQPGQLSTAVRTMDNSVGKGNVAKGQAVLQDLSGAASTVMPDAFGNPGTADAVGLGALAAGLFTAPAQTIPLTAGLGAASIPYFLMGRGLNSRVPVSMAPAPLPPLLPGPVAARLSRVAGVGGAASESALLARRRAAARAPR